MPFSKIWIEKTWNTQERIYSFITMCLTFFFFPCNLEPAQDLPFLNQNNSIKKFGVQKRLHQRLGIGVSARIFVHTNKSSTVLLFYASQHPGWTTVRAACQCPERATVLQLPAEFDRTKLTASLPSQMLRLSFKMHKTENQTPNPSTNRQPGVIKGLKKHLLGSAGLFEPELSRRWGFLPGVAPSLVRSGAGAAFRPEGFSTTDSRRGGRRVPPSLPAVVIEFLSVPALFLFDVCLFFLF